LLKIVGRGADENPVKRTPAAWLIAIVGASFIARMVVGWLRAVPALFPDEYTYAALGRSIAESGRPLVRGGSAHFPALLQPLVTAPAWLVGDVGLAYRLVQTIGALAMSLAAVPVFLLARRLGLSDRVALALAALAVLVPDLVYASFISSEALAYPLVLTAVYAATRALARPTRRAQLAFVLVAGLATLARIQFAALPVVFALAAVVLGARERRLKKALREQALALGLFLLAALAVFGSGPSRAFGVYRGVLDFHAGPMSVGHWAALDAMTLAYAAGWIIVPGALLGLWLALARPRSREELAFGATAVLLAAALLLEAGVLQASLPLVNGIQERYVFYAVPLIGIWFALYASRGWPLRVPHLALAAVLVVVSVRLPLSGYAVAATVDGSPILYAVYWLTGKLGQPGNGAGVFAAAAGVMSVVAILASRRPRLGTPVVLGLALLATGGASAGAVAFDVVNTGLAKRAFLPNDPSWVDRAGIGRVSLLQAYGGARNPSLQELFWNRSIDRVLLLPGAARIDRFGESRVRIAGDGSLLAGGRVEGSLLVDTYGSTVQLRGARMLEAGPTAALWVPAGQPRLALYALGRYHDGWLADAGGIYLWPAVTGGTLSGWLSMRLTAPPDAGPVTIRFRLPRGESTAVHVRPGAPERLSIAVCGDGDWYATFRSNVRGFVGLRAVSVRATAPVFTPSASACPAPEPLPSRGTRSSGTAVLPIETT
jgi:hypothetical protein